MYDRTEQLISELDHELIWPAIHLINAARSVGVPLEVISGLRSARRNRDVGGESRSQHLYGRAIDVGVQGYLVNQVPGWWWGELGAYAEHLGLRWGGRFKSRDVNHFDLGLMA